MKHRLFYKPYLEDGYKPKTYDNLAMILYPLYFAAMLAQKCTALACHQWPKVRALAVLNKVPHPIIKLLTIYFAADITSRIIFDDSDLLDDVFILSTGLVYNRNQLMADNIIKGFEDNPEKVNMLVTTGILHQYSIKKILIKQYGFKEMALESR